MTTTNPATMFLDRLRAGDLNGALALTTDRFTWSVAGKPGQFVLAGRYDRKKYRELLARVGRSLTSGPQMDIRSVTTGDDRVVIEAHVTGNAANGVHYDNDLIYAFDLEGDRIAAVREYLDTIHAQEAFA